MIWNYDERLANLGAKIIYCFKDKYTHFNDEVISEDRIDEIKYNYHRYLYQTKMPYLKLNTTDEDLDRELKEIMKWLKK